MKKCDLPTASCKEIKHTLAPTSIWAQFQDVLPKISIYYPNIFMGDLKLLFMTVMRQKTFYWKVVLQMVVAVTTTSCQTGLTAHLIAHICVATGMTPEIPEFFHNVRNSMRQHCQAYLTTSLRNFVYLLSIFFSLPLICAVSVLFLWFIVQILTVVYFLNPDFLIGTSFFNCNICFIFALISTLFNKRNITVFNKCY